MTLLFTCHFAEIKQSRSAKIGPFTVIGTRTSIGNNTEISNSVVGEGCSIGSNVAIEGCYIWHNVTIEDGCKLKHSIVCDGVTMKSGAALEPGVVLSFKVFEVPLAKQEKTFFFLFLDVLVTPGFDEFQLSNSCIVYFASRHSSLRRLIPNYSC